MPDEGDVHVYPGAAEDGPARLDQLKFSCKAAAVARQGHASPIIATHVP